VDPGHILGSGGFFDVLLAVAGTTLQNRTKRPANHVVQPLNPDKLQMWMNQQDFSPTSCRPELTPASPERRGKWFNI
jgi:hypothetical protein